MSPKVQKPLLKGQRFKPKKRDEKPKYDPVGFADAIIAGLDTCANNFEAISCLLDTFGSKLDYRRYGETLFDILIAGGILVPGATLSQDGIRASKTTACIFNWPAETSLELMKNWEQVFLKLMRRFKYLEKMFQDDLQKILLYMKYYSADQRRKLSLMVMLWVSNNTVPFSAVLVLNNAHLVKDNVALDFLIEVFKWWREDKSVESLHSAIKKSAMERQLASFIPNTKQSQQYFRTALLDNGFELVLKLYTKYQLTKAKKELQVRIGESLADGREHPRIVAEIKEFAAIEHISDSQIVCILWTTVMRIPVWSKKERVVATQTVQHLRKYKILFSAFTKSLGSELSLMLKVQEFCYLNMLFMGAFQRVVLLFYNADIFTEQVIMNWLKQTYSVKGKMMFVEQMKDFLEWLENAEEESE